MIDQGEACPPYQGITPLEGGSLLPAPRRILAQSKQLPTRLCTVFREIKTERGPAEILRAGCCDAPGYAQSVAFFGQKGRGYGRRRIAACP